MIGSVSVPALMMSMSLPVSLGVLREAALELPRLAVKHANQAVAAARRNGLPIDGRPLDAKGTTVC